MNFSTPWTIGRVATMAAGALVLTLSAPASRGASAAYAALHVVPAEAAPRTPLDRTKSDEDIEAEAAALAASGDFAGAAIRYRELTKRRPDSFVAWYNLACALAQLEHPDEAWGALERSIELGMNDLTHLRLDPHIEPLRGGERFADLEARWPEIMERQAEVRFARAIERFGRGYHTQRDDLLRVRFAVGQPRQTFDMAHEELHIVSRWAMEHLFANLADAEDGTVPWVTVVIPTDADFASWARERHGDAARGPTQQIAGTYDHDRKELVCKDLGSTLRHEVFHALHYRSQSLHAQRHAAWVLEGLAALVEDFDLDYQGTPVFVPSWRTNAARRAFRGGRLKTIEQLTSMPDHIFVGQSPLLHYAEARTLMLYMYAAGRLAEFYRNYVDTWEEDRTGLAAILRTFDATLPQIEASYRRWVQSLPTAPEQMHPPAATLGIDVDPERGEGLAVIRTVRGSPGRRAGLRPRDVLVAVNGQGTRDINELYRVLGRYTPGNLVVLTVRRGREILELNARLGRSSDYEQIVVPGG
ncbi:MAG: PDZ domain-containing protein [Planctomycetota bacterium]